MTHWSTKRKLSLAIHATVVLIPFGFSTVSALLFWHVLFGSWLLAAPMVAVIDVLALLGLVLFVAKIESPFVVLRHALPFISIVPLGLELFGLLAHNAAWVQWTVTIAASAILVAIAWQCFATIERLFIDPIDAAREKARQQAHALTLSLAQLREYESAADDFALERLQYRMPQVTVATLEPESAAPVLALSKSQQVKQLASERGVSESTIWRKIAKGEITLTESEA